MMDKRLRVWHGMTWQPFAMAGCLMLGLEVVISVTFLNVLSGS